MKRKIQKTNEENFKCKEKTHITNHGIITRKSLLQKKIKYNIVIKN